jgi:hypothetical protein
MSECQEQGFSGVTSEHIGMFLEKAKEFGIPGLENVGTTGQATHMGVTIKWAYDESANSLSVQCTESPFLLPCAMINNKIAEMVNAALSRTGMQGQAPDQS